MTDYVLVCNVVQLWMHEIQQPICLDVDLDEKDTYCLLQDGSYSCMENVIYSHQDQNLHRAEEIYYYHCQEQMEVETYYNHSCYCAVDDNALLNRDYSQKPLDHISLMKEMWYQMNIVLMNVETIVYHDVGDAILVYDYYDRIGYYDRMDESF